MWLQELWGEGITGAQYREDFISRAIRLGFTAPRILNSAPVVITDAHIKEMISGTEFVSETYRLFKLPGLLERTEEDYGQLAQYEVCLLQLLAFLCLHFTKETNQISCLQSYTAHLFLCAAKKSRWCFLSG